MKLTQQPNAAECPPVPQHTSPSAHKGGEGGDAGSGEGSGCALKWTELLWGKREGKGNFSLHSKLLG